MEPPHDSGQSVTAAYEGWFTNPDGTFSILFGYYNRNHKQELDIPVGPDNSIEPGGPDQGQPTHFLPRRSGACSPSQCPKDFGDKKLTWTLTANGKTTRIPVSLDPLWELCAFQRRHRQHAAVYRLCESGPFVQGPRGQSHALRNASCESRSLDVWVADDASVIPGATRPERRPSR